MKKISFMMILSIITLSFSSCSKDKPEDVIPGNTWKVTYLGSPSDNYTSLYAGYTFLFDESGELIADLNGTQTSGTWSIGEDDSVDKLFISISGNEAFDHLSEDWVIKSVTSVKVELKDDGNSQETATLEKI